MDRRPGRQDTYDLRDQIATDEHPHHDTGYPSDEEHSVLEDDSDGEDRDDYMDDDDGSSSLSIPNESIDFDLVYALHSFAATVEGQANVVKGDSLFLMDDSNSYWWLVRVLKTQEVGYIPAENIETPFERLARLNKHRNVDLASATQAELEETRDKILSSRTGSNHATPSPTPGHRGASRARSRQVRSVIFNVDRNWHRYPPAVWGDEEDDEEDIEWDDEDYVDVDPDLAEEQEIEVDKVQDFSDLPPGMEPDDGMSWEEGAVEIMQTQAQQSQTQAQVIITASPPAQEGQQDTLRRQQQQQMAQQRIQEEQQRTAAAPQTSPLRTQNSRERLAVGQDGAGSGSPPKVMDPAQVTETRKVSITPPVARSVEDVQNGGPILPSAFMAQQSEERKRTREEIEALEIEQRKKAKGSSARPSSANSEQQKTSGKLRKERSGGESNTDDEGGKEKKKKGGVLTAIFGRGKKDKSKDKGSLGVGSETGSVVSAGSADNVSGRNSGESGRSSSQVHGGSSMDSSSPTTMNARQQQQVVQQTKVSVDIRRPQGTPQQTPPSALHPQISQHATQLRQRDQQQQALYQQYLNRSPASPPDAQLGYGLQSASAVMGSTSFSSSQSSSSGLTPGPRPRPGSLILSPGAMDGQGVGLPDLSVIRVFAGENLQTEATFKTVLLNASTTAADLVRQALQRFRLPAGENENDYYLTIKQVEGSSAALMPNEKPLGVFETLVEAALELPKVKRSSVGSISSVASNLSMHPAIKKLPMNDFTDDSAVKFYLNRRRGERDESVTEDEVDETLMAESLEEDLSSPRSNHFLTINTSGTMVTPERFSSPSFRFALQLAIHPEDLPDDMVFDPLTEAIVFKNTLRDRPSNIGSSPGISSTQRRKVFVFPKNVTVAEVIEQGLERFGIPDGVVDGGDEVEDKLAKRRSSTRVRYCLAVDVNGKDKELAPTSKVIDAFPRPPSNRRSNDNKRRSADSAMLLGSIDDIAPDDPLFILRRAVAYRPSSKHRLSAPLDEIALQKLHRESISSSSIASDSTAGPEEPKRQLSKQEIIAAQRAATRANQRAILSAQANSSRGLDVILPGNAMIRSSRHDSEGGLVCYSYVEPDGETYDISEIVEAEWRGEAGPNRERNDASQSDLLHGVLSRGRDGLGAKLERVISQIKHDRRHGRGGSSQSEQVARATSPSVYTTAETNISSSRVATPNALAMNARSPTPTGGSAAAGQRAASPMSRLSSYRTASEGESDGRRTATPSSNSQHRVRSPHGRQQSFASVMSDSSQQSTSPTTPQTVRASSRSAATATPPKRIVLPKDDFGLAHMMAIIELKNAPVKSALPPLDPVDELLFGRSINLDTLHPQIRDIYSDSFEQLEEMDNALDELLQHVAHAF